MTIGYDAPERLDRGGPRILIPQASWPSRTLRPNTPIAGVSRLGDAGYSGAVRLR